MAAWSTVTARWRASEDRLWSGSMGDAATYQRAAHMVGLLVDELRGSTSTLDELLALDAEAGTVLRVLPEDAAAAVGGERLLLDAACAIRDRELAAAAERDRRVAAITAAREEGAAWVELEGPSEGPAVPGFTGSRSTEMHLESGIALVAVADPYGPGPGVSEPFLLEEWTMDAATGRPNGDDGEPRRRRSFTDPETWRGEHARWRTEVVGRHDGRQL